MCVYVHVGGGVEYQRTMPACVSVCVCVLYWPCISSKQPSPPTLHCTAAALPQCCAAGSRVYVHEAVYDEFVRKSTEAAATR